MNQDYNKIVDYIRFLFKPNNNSAISLHEPIFIGNEKKYLNECIESTFVSSIGKFVDKVEKEIALFTGSKYAVITSSGTAALHISLLLANIKPNDEVITQPLTFVATVNAIKYANAVPLFIDVETATLGMCPHKLEEFLNKNALQKYNSTTNQKETFNKLTGRKISGCVPMHTFGHPCKIDDIVNICKKYNIKVIEDCAESLGSYYKSIHTGLFGHSGIFSFNGNKIITSGGGGCIITNSKNIAIKAKHITTTAKVPHPWEYIHDELGYNYRMPNINAALLLAQIEKISFFIQRKRELTNKYIEFFKKTDICFFTEPLNSKSNYWLNTILLNNIKERNLFLELSNKKGVLTRPAWKPMNKLKMFEKYQTGDLSNSEYVSNRIINLPSSVIDEKT